MYKRIISFALVLVLLFSALPFEALAATKKYGSVPIYTGHAEVDYMASRVLAKIKTKGLTKEKQIQAVYDWIIKNCERYEWDGKYYFDQEKVAKKAESVFKTINDAVLSRKAAYMVDLSEYGDYTAYSLPYFAGNILYTRVGSCVEFASLLSVLLGQLGIDCRTVSGSFKNNDGSVVDHTWNYALVNGKYYWMDIRIDHAAYQGKAVPHTYFMKTDTKEWAKKHIWDDATSKKLAKNIKKIQNKYNTILNHKKHTYTGACDEYCNICLGWRDDAHTYIVEQQATFGKNGRTQGVCVDCYYGGASTIINAVKSVRLSETSFVCDGKVKTPAVVVKDSAGKVLTKNKDYKVSYEGKRKAPGKYTVTVTLQGKYTGKKTLSFTITPRKPIGISAKQTTNSVTLKWGAVPGAYGYRVYRYSETQKKYIALGDTRKTTLQVKNLKAGADYKFKVRAYDKESGYIWGDFSATFQTATKPATPTLKVSASGKGALAFRWTNVSGESGYQIYYSASKNGTYKKFTTQKANTAKVTKSNQKRGKTYYFKIRAYKKTKRGTICSAWSAPQKVKIK